MRRPPTPSASSRSLRSANVDDLCRRPALTISAVDTAPSTDVERSLTLPQTTSARRSPAMSSVRYPPRCSDLHRGTPISPDLHCDISASLAHRLYTVRQPRRQWKVTTWFGPSPVTRARDYQTMEGRQSSATSRCLVAIFRHCLSDQTPPDTPTSPSIADCCGLHAPTMTPPLSIRLLVQAKPSFMTRPVATEQLRRQSRLPQGHPTASLSVMVVKHQ